MIRILFIGDIVGKHIREHISRFLSENRQHYDFVLANAENAVSGAGITYPVLKELYSFGIDAVSMGNHTFSKKEILHFIESEKRLLRPANYPDGVPGFGHIILERENKKLLFMNLMGRVYMNTLTPDSPFIAADQILTGYKDSIKAVIVDFHAEATSEKGALAHYLDGRVSAVIGTHTHVQTADERILPNGTAFITDVGMAGPYEGIIGVKKEIILEKFLKQMPLHNQLSAGQSIFCAVDITIDEHTGKAIQIKRINKLYGEQICM
jgi:2',3'-cyclic-nucleotide 2'-phosphodiesterase